MPGWDLLAAFGLATLLFGYMPGPGMLYATARTLAGGRRAGFAAAFGLHLGGYVHVVAAAIGLAVLFQAVPVLYTALKLVGALYLIWLGISLFRGSEEGAPADVNNRSPRRAFWQSVSVEVLNPKTALFFLAFLPQFTDPAAALPLWAQLLVLGCIVNVVFSSADILCVLMADRVIRWLRGSAQTMQYLRWLGGTVLIGLGLRLALSRG